MPASRFYLAYRMRGGVATEQVVQGGTAVKFRRQLVRCEPKQSALNAEKRVRVVGIPVEDVARSFGNRMEDDMVIEELRPVHFAEGF